MDMDSALVLNLGSFSIQIFRDTKITPKRDWHRYLAHPLMRRTLRQLYRMGGTYKFRLPKVPRTKSSAEVKELLGGTNGKRPKETLSAQYLIRQEHLWEWARPIPRESVKKIEGHKLMDPASFRFHV